MLSPGDVEKHLTQGVKAYYLGGVETYGKRVASYIIRGPAYQSVRSIFCRPERSTQQKETYTDMGLIQPIQEWTGTVGFGGTEEYSVDIENKDWIGGYAIHEKVIRRNKVGGFLIKAEQLGERTEFFRDKRALELLAETRVPNTYDAKPLFSTTHRKGASTQSNKPTGTALADTIFQTNWGLMEGFRDPLDREPVGALPRHIMVGKDLRFTVVQVVANTLKIAVAGAGEAAAIPNPIAAYNIEISCVAHTIAADAWYLIDNQHASMPCIDQTEKDPELRTTLGDPADAVRRKTGMIEVQSDFAGEVGPAEYLWILRGK